MTVEERTIGLFCTSIQTQHVLPSLRKVTKQKWCQSVSGTVLPQFHDNVVCTPPADITSQTSGVTIACTTVLTPMAHHLLSNTCIGGWTAYLAV
jgi:hypothetical protein